MTEETMTGWAVIGKVINNSVVWFSTPWEGGPLYHNDYEYNFNDYNFGLIKGQHIMLYIQILFYLFSLMLWILLLPTATTYSFVFIQTSEKRINRYNRLQNPALAHSQTCRWWDDDESGKK